MTEEFLTDDEQLEEVKRLVGEYAPWIIPAMIVGLGFVFGYRYYHSHQEQRALDASVQFSGMNAAIQSNDHAKARQLADALIKDYPRSPYADQAQLAVARLYVDDGEDANAIAPLTQVMEHSADSELRHVARLRLARVQIDQQKPDEALKTLSDDPGAFAAAYHEVRGDAYYAKKDLTQAAEPSELSVPRPSQRLFRQSVSAGFHTRVLTADSWRPRGESVAAATIRRTPRTEDQFVRTE